MKRVVNINFKCEGLNFDAAIDCDNAIKETLGGGYLPEEISEYRTNIELYCFDRPWGVRFIHYEGDPDVVVNDKEADTFGHYHTVCDMDEIMAAARKWIKEKEEEEDAKFSGVPPTLKLQRSDWRKKCCAQCKYQFIEFEGKKLPCSFSKSTDEEVAEFNEHNGCQGIREYLETGNFPERARKTKD